MHFLHTVGWAVLLGSFGAAVAMPEAEPGTLEARACYCVGAHQGQYCGYCAEVRGDWIADHVYECNSRGGCSHYGYRGSCARRQGPCG
ncbi:hypothetical protein ACCO45_000406 [Purpureocillium lilacinum]|uniref:Uncharacterized protein n=1 Tax=Purpureocillium lilacinum TaxID=33203 RepID=A0ACC4E558_PURLI